MSAAKQLDIPPKFIACLLDISGHYTDTEEGRAFLKRCGGKIYFSGFFDDSVNTHLCSSSPSVWVDVVEICPEKYPEDEHESDLLNCDLIEMLQADDNDYWSRRDIERMKVAHPDRFKELDFNFDEDSTDQERQEQVHEHLQGNPVF
jgi:hypothetical protein